MNHRVLITDYAWPTLDQESAVLHPGGAELVVAQSGAEEELLALVPDCAAILTNWKKVSARVLDAAPGCRIVSRYGVGVDNIDVAHCTKLGIIVTNVPDYCKAEVSDHAMALLLSLARRVTHFAQDTAQGEWNIQKRRPIPRLNEQTLGLIGFGNMARGMAPRARGFGLRVVVYDRSLPAGEIEPGVTALASLDELLGAADYVSMHVPLLEGTREMVNAAFLAKMKPSAYLINTSRGGVVHEGDLLKALLERRIAGAGLDVLQQEPPPADHPLLHLDNCIVTPHAAFYSETATRELAERSARHVALALRGERPPHIINPQVLEQANCRLPAN